MTRTASRTGRGNFRLLCAGAGASSRSRTRRCVQEWSDLSSACPEARFASSGVLCSFGVAPGEVPINIYGPGSDSGTYGFFAEATLCEDCFAGSLGRRSQEPGAPEPWRRCLFRVSEPPPREDGYDPEGFPYCPLDKHSALEQLSTEPDIADFIQNQRPPRTVALVGRMLPAVL